MAKILFLSSHNKIASFLKVTLSILIEFVQLSVDDSRQNTFIKRESQVGNQRTSLGFQRLLFIQN